jgi:hypothetical protein
MRESRTITDMLWWYDKRSRLAVMLSAVTVLSLIAYVVAPDPAKPVPVVGATTTVAPTPVSGVTTPRYSMRVELTAVLNTVASNGGFVPRLNDLTAIDGEITFWLDEGGDGFDDDGKFQLARADDIICVQLPGEADGSRVMTITDGQCQS